MTGRSGSSQLAGTLAAASFVAVTQLVTKDVLDGWLISSLCVFSISLPLLAMAWFKEPFSQPVIPKQGAPEFDRFVLFVSLVLFNVAGIALLFFHFSIWLGSLFCVAAYGALLTFFQSNAFFPLKIIVGFATHPFTYLISKIRVRRAGKPGDET